MRMIDKISKAIPARSLGYILICGGIILVIVLGIVSFHRYNSNKAQGVQKLQNQIDEQKGLGPVYLFMIKELQKKQVYSLPNPGKLRLSRQESDRFQDIVRQVAAKSGLMALTVLPDVKTISGANQNLLFNTTLKGELPNFRKFIIELGTIPYIDQIEEVNIKQYSDSMEYKLKIRVALAN